MILKGLSRYDITVENGKVRVISKTRSYYNKEMTPSNRLGKNRWYLSSDEGKRVSLTEEQLLFLIKNRHLSLIGINCKKLKIEFSEKGEVLKSRGSERARRFDVFQSYDDALETIMIMKRYKEGDVSFLYNFCEQNKERAIAKTQRLSSCSQETVRLCWPVSLEIFDYKVKNLTIKKIVPLYALLVLSLREAVREYCKIKKSSKANYLTNLRAPQICRSE